MKTILKSLVVIIILLITFPVFQSNADPTPQTIPVELKKKPNPYPDPDPDPHVDRKPSMPIPCFLSLENGIQCDFISEEILTYEIWNEDDSFCMASYMDEEDFIYHIFYIPGDYLIKLVTQDYIYFGYISTL